ncbi:hypothetical protein Pmar_PMAR004547 [Perkinsus marinus ATCC 50983]|uniref:Potassium channel domain-containing protein n=1 Tax=Perkinsus marinus (strain ATCC 50983 / TXsc) TaxID=423536 RepID=C5LZY8_PERM5|nr:hypothetical protein Pmar_PMAR004547 [Perkinsus marinus ATCC 50983]EEQ97806.1 hypothetical protein Pmar_PMAR004547 [Perkinsus marinus ATCC 50983]|eukprot:XP_002765089.1 hypothetical protein Pmar_PMAR004547 [Perkinsus marinus ATCC 50983]
MPPPGFEPEIFLARYIIVILLYAICFWSFDSNFVCTNHVHDFGDYYFFVVQTLFTIGYGGKEPLCFVTNVGVTIISILGLLQHTALTGIVFAKFTLDSSRDLACAFSTRLFAIPPCEDSFTALGGAPSGLRGQLELSNSAGTPGGRSVVSGAIAEGPTSTSTVGQHFWVRHFSEHYKVARQMSGAPPMALPHTMPVAPNIWPSHEISAKKSWPLTDVTWLPPGTDISMCWMSIVQRVGNTGVYNVDVSNLDSIATYDYEDSEACSSFGGTSSYGVQSPEREVDFSKSSPEFSVDTSLVNHVSRPTVSRVWSSAATAEAAKDEEFPDPTWNIRLGIYRGDFEASPEKDDEGDNKLVRRDNDRLSRLRGGVSNRWLSAEDPKSLLSSKTVGNEFSQSNVTADVTSRSAAAILSNAAAGSASRNQRYMRSRTMSNIGEIGSRFSVGNRKQSQRRAFGAGLVDSLD